MENNGAPPYLPSLGRLLGFATGATNALSQKLLDRHGLSLTHWIILTALWRRDGLSIGDIADYYRVKSPAASRIVDRMADRGLVERRPDPRDRRASRVYLTDKAREMADLVDFYRDVNSRLLDGFSKEETDRLFALLERVAANAAANLAPDGD